MAAPAPGAVNMKSRRRASQMVKGASGPPKRVVQFTVVSKSWARTVKKEVTNSMTFGKVKDEIWTENKFPEAHKKDFICKLAQGEVYFYDEDQFSDLFNVAKVFKESSKVTLPEVLILPSVSLGDAYIRREKKMDPTARVMIQSACIMKSKGTFGSSWKKRWLVVQGMTLLVFESEKHAQNKKTAQEVIHLGSCPLLIKKEKHKDHYLADLDTTRTNGGIFEFGFDKPEVLKKWKLVFTILNLRRIKSTTVAICEELSSRGLDSIKGIFRVSGKKETVEQLKSSFDNGKHISLGTVEDSNALAAVLKQALREMPEPLLTYSLYQEFIDTAKLPKESQTEALTAVMKKMPVTLQNLLDYLCNFLNIVASFSDTNMMKATNLSIVIAPNILRPRVETAENSIGDNTSVLVVVERFIQDHDLIWPPANILSLFSATNPAGAPGLEKKMSLPPTLPSIPGTGTFKPAPPPPKKKPAPPPARDTTPAVSKIEEGDEGDEDASTATAAAAEPAEEDVEKPKKKTVMGMGMGFKLPTLGPGGFAALKKRGERSGESMDGPPKKDAAALAAQSAAAAATEDKGGEGEESEATKKLDREAAAREEAAAEAMRKADQKKADEKKKKEDEEKYEEEQKRKRKEMLAKKAADAEAAKATEAEKKKADEEADKAKAEAAATAAEEEAAAEKQAAADKAAADKAEADKAAADKAEADKAAADKAEAEKVEADKAAAAAAAAAADAKSDKKDEGGDDAPFQEPDLGLGGEGDINANDLDQEVDEGEDNGPIVDEAAKALERAQSEFENTMAVFESDRKQLRADLTDLWTKLKTQTAGVAKYKGKPLDFSDITSRVSDLVAKQSTLQSDLMAETRMFAKALEVVSSDITELANEASAEAKRVAEAQAAKEAKAAAGDGEAAPAPAAARKYYAVAKYAYKKGTRDDDIDLEIGDRLEVLGRGSGSEAGWWQGVNERTKVTGFFPAGYVDLEK